MRFERGEELRAVHTARLHLTPAGLNQLEDITALLGDERVWRHLPRGRHTSADQTRDWLARCERQWQRDRLGYWTARLREAVAGVEVGRFVGVGGCAVGSVSTVWNLSYRLSPEVHRHGLATELCEAAIAAAHYIAPHRPVVARLLEHNHASEATARRVGLALAWRGPAAGLDAAHIRLLYSDRPLGADQISELARLA